MAKYLTRQRKRLLEYLSEHTDEQMSARQIADALAADEISVSAVYRNLSALEEEGLLKRSVREGTRENFSQYIAAEECKDSLHLSCRICGKSIHLGEYEAAQLLQGTLESTGFQINKSETILYGVCADQGKAFGLKVIFSKGGVCPFAERLLQRMLPPLYFCAHFWEIKLLFIRRFNF